MCQPFKRGYGRRHLNQMPRLGNNPDAQIGQRPKINTFRKPPIARLQYDRDIFAIDICRAILSRRRLGQRPLLRHPILLNPSQHALQFRRMICLFVFNGSRAKSHTIRKKQNERRDTQSLQRGNHRPLPFAEVFREKKKIIAINIAIIIHIALQGCARPRVHLNSIARPGRDTLSGQRANKPIAACRRCHFCKSPILSILYPYVSMFFCANSDKSEGTIAITYPEQTIIVSI